MNTLSVRLPHPPNIPNIEPSPLRTVCPMICPVLLKYPDEFILNTKVVQNSSANTDTPSYACRMSSTPPTWYLPPPDTLSGNHPELADHPRMNSRSEQRASYYVRASIAYHLSCDTMVCYACLVFIVSSPPLLLSGSPDDRCR